MIPQSAPDQIAHYRVTSKLGEGGMGAVYRATDTKLNRDVAIKVLPDAFASDPDRLARFTREAQVLASLNHPNIAVIYGVEERALVMELVEGAAPAGPMSVEEALPLIHQLIDALDYAHEKGVIHRDLKPANLKITADGRLKVLDFGLAKAIAGETAVGDPVNSPTLTLRATVAGVIMGTAGYMSPEQARGQAVDRRADIWAFGVVVYELVTGRTLFDGPTVTDTLAAVMRENIDFEAVPQCFRKMLRLCLERDPRKRLRDIGDVRLLLDEAEPADPAPAASRSAFPWIVAAAGVVAAAALAIVHFRETAPPPRVMRFSVPAPAKSAISAWLNLSPDGRHLGFTAVGPDGGTSIWIRSLDSMEARPLAGTDGVNTFFWSPDSRFVVFGSLGKVKKIDIGGGPPESLCTLSGAFLGGSWSSDGVILFGGSNSPVLRISAAGGEAVPATALDASRNETNHTYPQFLRDERHFLYLRRSMAPEMSGIYVGTLDLKPDQQPAKRIAITEVSFAYLPSQKKGGMGRVAFVRDRSVVTQAFDEEKLELSGDPVPVTDEVSISLSRAAFTTARTGILAYRSGGGGSAELQWVDREGRPGARLGAANDYGGELSISPDGGRLAYGKIMQGGNQVYILDLARGITTRLSFTPDGGRDAVWSPDGKRVAFGAGMNARTLYIKDASNAGAEEVALRTPESKILSHWSGDGRFLLYSVLMPAGRDVMALPLVGDRKPVPVANSPFNETQGQFSPDSRWVAYVSDESGRYEVYVRPFPPGDGRSGQWPVSSSGGSQPRWRPDGKELFYLAPDGKLMALEVVAVPGGATLRLGTPQPLFPTQTPRSITTFSYDISRDGKRFLLFVPSAEVNSAPIHVVVNWEAALRK